MTSKQFSKWFREQRIKKKLSVKDLCLKANSAGIKRSYGWFSNLERIGEFAKVELDLLNGLSEFFGYHLALVPIQEGLSESEQKTIHKQYQEAEDERIERKIGNKNW